MSGWKTGSLGDDVFEELAEGLGGAALQSMLLEVMRRRARARTPAEVLDQYRRDPFTGPSDIDQRIFVEVDRHLLAAADGFDAVELSPVAPLGVCSAIAATDQNRVLSALRRTEVVSDPTNVLALECASRMRAAPRPVHLATSQRVLRAQPFPKAPGFAQHFRLFVLASGGVEAKDHAFTVDALLRHARTFTAAFDRLEQHGFAFGPRRVDVLAAQERAEIGDRIADRLRSTRLPCERKPLAHPYYSGGIRLMYWVTAPDGHEIALADGGSFDWLGRLLSNRRAVLVASGLGSQLVASRFRVS